ncbi:MAG: norD [Moraxellaceae bacterium]|nr:norD [Moraxellaceae bacterium]
MPEAEDVITDVARHATDYVRGLWQRRRGPGPQPLSLQEAAPRLDLLLTAVFGRRFPLRVAQPPAPPTLLGRLFHRHDGPHLHQALPATDGVQLWLPFVSGLDDPAAALRRFRLLALLQAQRAVRGSSGALPVEEMELVQALYLLLEARAAERVLLAQLPGLAAELAALHHDALAARPPLAKFPAWRRPLEWCVRASLGEHVDGPCTDPEASGAPTSITTAGAAARMLRALPDLRTPAESAEAARELALAMTQDNPLLIRSTMPLLKDVWTGELRPSASVPRTAVAAGEVDADEPPGPPRSARLERRPTVRESPEDENDDPPGAWMIQTSEPHEKAEDPVGLQRPTDRDETTAAEDFAESLAELPEARLVTTPGRPREVLLSDDPPEARSRQEYDSLAGAGARLAYPEWDYRLGGYRAPGAFVHLLPAREGDEAWIARTLEKHRGLLASIRRRFEMLRARRVRLHRQLDGDDIDLAAYIESEADFRAGLPRAQALYQHCRPARSDLALLLLIDVSGSTDGWVSRDLRVIDVEREALLLVSIALDGLGEPYAIHAFSGEGPGRVTVHPLKTFSEPHSAAVARRIAALEPEHYTRAGAALRHATATLMRQPAQHRLLLLLSDGKPNDIDDYEGRYGVEDMRQAVTEARLQGLSCFCLTIDRQAANYLPAVFGTHHYALLQDTEKLPLILLDWLKRLVTA